MRRQHLVEHLRGDEFKLGRVGKRVFRTVTTWNGASNMSHDAVEITESLSGKSCIRIFKYI